MKCSHQIPGSILLDDMENCGTGSWYSHPIYKLQHPGAQGQHISCKDNTLHTHNQKFSISGGCECGVGGAAPSGKGNAWCPVHPTNSNASQKRVHGRAQCRCGNVRQAQTPTPRLSSPAIRTARCRSLLRAGPAPRCCIPWSAPPAPHHCISQPWQFKTQ